MKTEGYCRIVVTHGTGSIQNAKVVNSMNYVGSTIHFDTTGMVMKVFLRK